MIKLSELTPGDIVMAEYEGQRWEGVVKELNRDDKEICVETSVQEFWFTPEHVFPILLDEEQLLKLGFEKKENEDGSVKYSKESFRVLVPEKGNFNKLRSGGVKINAGFIRPYMCMNFKITILP